MASQTLPWQRTHEIVGRIAIIGAGFHYWLRDCEKMSLGKRGVTYEVTPHAGAVL
jgi:hypothetical protein